MGGGPWQQQSRTLSLFEGSSARLPLHYAQGVILILVNITVGLTRCRRALLEPWQAHGNNLEIDG